tara:strand:- start:1113 stop:1439 length:327 start_codon:yes stop_codon:yes gene_type:complete
MEINMQKKYDPIEILNLKKPETPGKWGKVVAIFDLKIMGFMEIKGCKYIDGEKGFFLAFPSNKGKDDKFYNTIWTDDRDGIGLAFRQDVENALSNQIDFDITQEEVVW